MPPANNAPVANIAIVPGYGGTAKNQKPKYLYTCAYTLFMCLNIWEVKNGKHNLINS